MVLAVFNGERYVAHALQSALDQDWHHLEVVVVDDGSTDATREVIAAFDDERVVYIWQENRGVAAARNVGIAAASGTYIAFLDADDLWLRDKTSRQVEVLDARPTTALVHGGYVIVDQRLSPLATIIPRGPETDVDRLLRLEGNGIGLSATGMARADVLREVGGFDEQLSTSADLDLIWRIAASHDLAAVSAPLALYRSHPLQMHRQLDVFEEDMTLVIDKALSLRGDVKRVAAANLHLRLAAGYALQGASAVAMRHLLMVVRSGPAQLARLPLSILATRMQRRRDRRAWRKRVDQALALHR